MLPVPRLRDDHSTAQLDLEIELTAMNATRFSRESAPGRERGTMLIIALIVLVALTLAGIATMRSVDTAGIAAGNIGFRQSAVYAADQGLKFAYNWLGPKLADPAAPLNNDDNAPANSNGYFASVPLSGDPDWTQSAAWQNAALVNGGAPDAGQNVISYRIDRMCTCSGATSATCPTGAPQVCGATPSNLAISNEGNDQSQANQFTRPPAVHYRITVRAVGPRNSIAIVQTMVRGQ
jgi:type IV pilus assembly protein PilX